MVSVIIPYYNASDTIERGLQSIINQSAFLSNSVPYEIIIVDDGSRASESKKVKRLQKNISFVLISTEINCGPSSARNLAIKNAKGEFIAFLDADDEWPLYKIENQLYQIEVNQLDISGGRIKYIFDKIDRETIDLSADDTINHIHLGTILVKSDIFSQNLFFDEELRYSEDWDWWLRVIEKKLKISISEEVYLHYYRHGRNMTTDTTLTEVNLLQVFHKSIKRRNSNRVLPQIRDFRTEIPDPLISVVLPVHNGEQYLTNTLNSIKKQSYKNIELIVINDGSTDQSERMLLDFDYPIQYYHQKNEGVAQARNKGIRESKGNFVAFIDQDDEWHPDKLQLQINELKSNPYLGFITCKQEIKISGNQTTVKYIKRELIEKPHKTYVPSAILVRKHILLSVNGFNPIYQLGSDTDLISKMRDRGVNEGFIDRVLLLKWHHDKNESKQVEQSQKELLKALHEHLKRKNGRS